MSEYEQDQTLNPDENSIALAIIRQSQGRDDSMSLVEQRDVVPELIHSKADVDVIEFLDLGVHTGFSIHSKNREQERVDDNDDYLAALDAAKNGRYDLVAAVDESRIARDEYIHQWRLAAEYGGFEFLFKFANADDELTAGVTRVVEREVKKKEAQKAMEAINRRIEKGFYQGDAPFGMRFDDRGEYLVKDEGEFEVAISILDWVREDGMSYRASLAEAEDEYPSERVPALGTVSNIIDRGATYDVLAMGGRVGCDGPFLGDD